MHALTSTRRGSKSAMRACVLWIVCVGLASATKSSLKNVKGPADCKPCVHPNVHSPLHLPSMQMNTRMHAHLNRARLCLAMVVVVMVMAFERRRSAVAHCVVNVLRARGPMRAATMVVCVCVCVCARAHTRMYAIVEGVMYAVNTLIKDCMGAALAHCRARHSLLPVIGRPCVDHSHAHTRRTLRCAIIGRLNKSRPS